MRNKYDVLIIGGGVFGAAIFYYLSKNTSLTVCLLEQKKFCSGATRHSGGFIRMLHPSKKLSELAARSFKEYVNFKQNIGTSCGFVETGFTTLMKKSDFTLIKDNIKILRNLNIKIEIFDTASVVFNGTHFYIADDEVLLYEPNSGYADPFKVTMAYIEKGIELGGIAIEHHRVKNLIIDGDKVVGVQTDNKLFEYIQSNCVVVSAGVNTDKILSKNNIKKSNTSSNFFLRKQICLNIYSYPDKHTILPTFMDKVSGLYARNCGNGRCILGLTENLSLVEFQYKLYNIAKHVIPDFHKYTLYKTANTFESYTNDNLGISEFSDQIQGVFICSGWSGCGFKIAPECGKQAAAKISNFFNI
ncbi:MAG: hypothetical protein DGJ47_000702 [Rickettsiaceae bacterium]